MFWNTAVNCCSVLLSVRGKQQKKYLECKKYNLDGVNPQASHRGGVPFRSIPCAIRAFQRPPCAAGGGELNGFLLVRFNEVSLVRLLCLLRRYLFQLPYLVERKTHQDSAITPSNSQLPTPSRALKKHHTRYSSTKWKNSRNFLLQGRFRHAHASIVDNLYREHLVRTLAHTVHTCVICLDS